MQNDMALGATINERVAGFFVMIVVYLVWNAWYNDHPTHAITALPLAILVLGMMISVSIVRTFSK